MRNPAGEEIDATIAAADIALSAIRLIGNSQQKLEAAGRLAEALRLRSDEAAKIRHAEALEIYKTESLSLAQLADRVGISKARADQIVNPDRKRKKEEAADA